MPRSPPTVPTACFSPTDFWAVARPDASASGRATAQKSVGEKHAVGTVGGERGMPLVSYHADDFEDFRFGRADSREDALADGRAAGKRFRRQLIVEHDDERIAVVVGFRECAPRN